MRLSLFFACGLLYFVVPGFTAHSPASAHSLPALAPPTTSPAVYWHGQAGGYTYRWTGKDLTATHASTTQTVFSVAQALRQEVGKIDADEGGFSSYEVTFAPVSVVGPLLSYERDDMWEGERIPPARRGM